MQGWQGTICFSQFFVPYYPLPVLKALLQQVVNTWKVKKIYITQAVFMGLLKQAHDKGTQDISSI
jgi:hypothetical protein